MFHSVAKGGRSEKGFRDTLFISLLQSLQKQINFNKKSGKETENISVKHGNQKTREQQKYNKSSKQRNICVKTFWKG